MTKTYTLRLCRNGKQFHVATTLDDGGPRPGRAGTTIDSSWRVVKVIRDAEDELVLDVEPL